MVTIHEALLTILLVTLIYKIIEYWNKNPMVIIYELSSFIRFIKNLFKKKLGY